MKQEEKGRWVVVWLLNMDSRFMYYEPPEARKYADHLFQKELERNGVVESEVFIARAANTKKEAIDFAGAEYWIKMQAYMNMIYKPRKFPQKKARELVRQLQEDGWEVFNPLSKNL